MQTFMSNNTFQLFGCVNQFLVLIICVIDWFELITFLKWRVDINIQPFRYHACNPINIGKGTNIYRFLKWVNLLFCLHNEVDAILEDWSGTSHVKPVEIKSGKKSHFNIDVLFQMLRYIYIRMCFYFMHYIPIYP